MNIKNKGILLALCTALVSGFAVFFNKFAVSFWQSSSVYTTAKNLVVVLLLCSAILLFRKMRELKALSSRQWRQLILIGFVGGSVPFLLFFKGLSLTAPTNVAFLHKTLFVWVALLAVPFLKEKITWLQAGALGVILAGVYFFVGPSNFTFGLGEFLALSATLFWAIENVIAKKVLKDLSSLVLAWGRMFFGSVFLLLFLVFSGGIGELLAVPTLSQFAWLFLAGSFLFGYVVSWYTALKYAPATVVSSVLVLAAPLTAVLNLVFIKHSFDGSIIVPILLMLTGIIVFNKLSLDIFKSLKKGETKTCQTVS